MNAAASEVTTGACLCGAVHYEVRGALRDVCVCHCSRCLRWHGHVGAYSSCESDAFKLTAGADRLRWYRADGRERGFCVACGSSLFWRVTAGQTISLTAGSLTPPTNLQITDQIFIDSAGDYYEVCGPGRLHPQGLRS